MNSSSNLRTLLGKVRLNYLQRLLEVALQGVGEGSGGLQQLAPRQVELLPLRVGQQRRQPSCRVKQQLHLTRDIPKDKRNLYNLHIY